MGSSSGTLNLKIEETKLKMIGGARVCPNAEFPRSPGDCLGDSLPEPFGSTYILKEQVLNYHLRTRNSPTPSVALILSNLKI